MTFRRRASTVVRSVIAIVVMSSHPVAQIPGSVRAITVEVRGKLIQYRAQVSRPGYEHPVGDLGPDCAYQRSA